MYLEYLNSNRHRITKFAFCIFVIVGILNLNIGSGLVTFAEEVTAEAPVETTVTEDAPEEIIPATENTETDTPEQNSEQDMTSGEASITTGDALSETLVENEQNTNEVQTNLSTTTESENIENNDQKIATTTTNLIVSGENTATTTNEVIGGANTGGNTATSTATSTISTGDAVATADVVNEVNTTIVNSEGDIFAGSGSLEENSLDLRSGMTSGSSSGCDSCIRNLEIENQNTATVTNSIYLVASTGNNTSSSSSSVVNTGDAVAAANIVNVVNTNIIDSNYLFFAFNNLGDWSGDIILPNSDFFINFFKMFNSGLCSDCLESIQIENINQAEVANSLDTTADSGNNTLNQNNASGETSLTTGDAVSSTNVINEINTNVYNDSSFYLIVKVLGDWAGNIFNLPENIGWQKIDDSVVFYDLAHNPFENLNQNLSNSSLSAENTNTANIENNLYLKASTGENSLMGGNSVLNTGNAYASANIINVVNTNIISSNWVKAIVNVFGNWDGNISFGQPDIWIGTTLESEGVIGPATNVKFKTVIKNNGDALASKVKLKIFSDSENLKFSGILEKDFDIGNLLPGESKEIFYEGHINPFLPFGNSEINNYISATSYETDANTKDNQDTLSILATNSNGPTIVLPYKHRESNYPNLFVQKSHILQNGVVIDGEEASPVGSAVDYKVIIKNNGGSAFEGVLIDQLKNEAGEIIGEQFWELDQIYPNEQIEITYTTNFSLGTTPGIYTNYAWVEALGGDYTQDKALASKEKSNIAVDTVVISSLPVGPQEILEEVAGEILGVYKNNALSVVENNYYEETSEYYLGGLCVDKQDEGRKISIKETLLYSLSFVLIVRKKKNIPMNLFML